MLFEEFFHLIYTTPIDGFGKIAFSVRDKEKGSFQIKGTAERLTEGDMFDEVQKWVPDKLPRVAAIVMNIEEIYNGAECIS